MPNWNEFAWSAFIYGSIGGDFHYQKLMRNIRFLNPLRINPSNLRLDEIRDVLIAWLNSWKTRVTKDIGTARSMKAKIINIQPALNLLRQQRNNIRNIDFNQVVALNQNNISVGNIIAHCYDTLKQTYRVGPTACAKILHILYPPLFVMWDNAILEHYNNINRQINDSGVGYVEFLKEMNRYTVQIDNSFFHSSHNPPANQNELPENYLNRNLAYDLPKPIAKYLDEYCWVTITNEVIVPPNWHP